MTAQSKPGPESESVQQPEPSPPTTFKNSLRAWQAQYRARLAAQAAVWGKADSPTAPPDGSPARELIQAAAGRDVHDCGLPGRLDHIERDPPCLLE